MATALTPKKTDRSVFKRFLTWAAQDHAGDAPHLVAPIRGEVLGVERLAERARAVARQQRLAAVPTVRPRGAGPLLRRLDDTREVLAGAQRALNDAALQGIDISSAGEWLLDN